MRRNSSEIQPLAGAIGAVRYPAGFSAAGPIYGLDKSLLEAILSRNAGLTHRRRTALRLDPAVQALGLVPGQSAFQK